MDIKITCKAPGGFCMNLKVNDVTIRITEKGTSTKRVRKSDISPKGKITTFINFSKKIIYGTVRNNAK